jgi:hypothetical protein
MALRIPDSSTGMWPPACINGCGIYLSPVLVGVISRIRSPFVIKQLFEEVDKKRVFVRLDELMMAPVGIA